MAFESLSDRLSKTLKKFTGQGKLTEANMNDMLKEVRYSLLEADVNYGVVTKFINSVKEKAMGQKVLSALNPGQMVVKIVRDELQELLGQEDARINFAKQGQTSIMMAGLQGTGKTTAAGKIARYARNKLGKRVLLVAGDVVRPAAVDQLKTLGESVGVDVFSLPQGAKAIDVARQGQQYARDHGYELVIYDTAGRLHVDEALMAELKDMQELIQPENVLLTVDAMTGQDIVTVAREFNDQLNITGLVVTKMDGDARGGGLLSVRSITSVPVLFVSSGEKMEDLDEFHPDRMADRILGMGDMLTLIEQAQDKMDQEELAASAQRMMSGQFTFNDMLSQYEQVTKMGSMKKMMKMVPGMNQLSDKLDDDVMNREIKKYKAIIQSMTPYEREHPNVLKASRKQRIAKGSGTTQADVNKLMKQLEQMQAMSRMMSGQGLGSLMNMFGGRSRGGMPMGLGRGGGIPGGGRHSGSKKKKKKKKK